MPSDSWVPLPHEADRFYQVYIDESSQNKHKYMVLGGLCVPLSHSAKFGTTKQSLDEARNIMNAGARKYSNRTDWPYRELRFQDPEVKQSLQVVDILIGAIAYHLNGHYQKSDGNQAKKQLSEHILRWAKITNPTVNMPWYRPRLTILHRDGTVRTKRK